MEERKVRIELTDSFQDVVLKMGEGNPGALTVCMNLAAQAEKIDPDAALGYINPLMLLDSFGIYAERIWMLYKEVCMENVGTMLGILRANQLGFLSRDKLNHAIDHNGAGIDVEDLIAKVKERLPNFHPMPPLVIITEDIK